MARRSSDAVPGGLPRVDLRPQTVLLTFFGDYVSTVGEAVPAAGIVEVLASAGVGTAATRATLARMVRRGLLNRTSAGRQALFGLTDFGRRTVLDGRQRAQESDVVDGDWDGRWTVVAFSLADDARRQRHALRSRLAWAGFGMVQAGVWAAPRDVDVVALLADLEVLAHVTAFRGQPLPPTDGGALLRASFDLDALAARYEAFDSRWVTLRSVAPEDLVDPLTARVLLSADWLQVLRDDPRLPQEFLPPTWPATAARDLHHALESQWRRPAEREARRRLQIVRVDSPASTGEG